MNKKHIIVTAVISILVTLIVILGYIFFQEIKLVNAHQDLLSNQNGAFDQMVITSINKAVQQSQAQAQAGKTQNK